MGLLDGPMRQLGSTLTRKFGTTAILRQVISGTLDLTTDTIPQSTRDYAVPASIREYTAKELVGDLQTGDLRVEVPALDLEKAADDGAIRPDATWQVIWLGAIMPVIGDVQVMYVGDLPGSYVLTARAGGGDSSAG